MTGWEDVMEEGKRLDLNSAERKLLTQLPGVTKDVSYKVVNYRRAHGGFRDWAQVQEATGLSAEHMAAVQERAFLGPRPAAESHERKTISRWMGKPDDEAHRHG